MANVAGLGDVTLRQGHDGCDAGDGCAVQLELIDVASTTVRGSEGWATEITALVDVEDIVIPVDTLFGDCSVTVVVNQPVPVSATLVTEANVRGPGRVLSTAVQLDAADLSYDFSAGICGVLGPRLRFYEGFVINQAGNALDDLLSESIPESAGCEPCSEADCSLLCAAGVDSAG